MTVGTRHSVDIQFVVFVYNYFRIEVDEKRYGENVPNVDDITEACQTSS